jgi:hypothetical protein
VADTSGLEVAHIFRLYGEEFRQGHRLSRPQLRAMRAIEICRTAVLGGHVDECDQCGARKISYNSCRNRHCPKCQGLEKQKWLEQRCRELLPVAYFHVVFTVPEELNSLALANPQWFYDLLFDSASKTLLEIAADPKHLGARIGALAVLHTWGQTLGLHPHLHCIVPGGGLSLDRQRWVAGRKGFLLPIQVLARVFRGKFLAGVKQAWQAQRLLLSEGLRDRFVFLDLLDRLYRKSWVVYSKPPFGSPEQVLGYLARYTHRVAISNHRLQRLKDDRVTFSYKDYSQRGKVREMTLPAAELIRRFLLHVLPEGFVRIRYYGLLANRHRAGTLARCRELLGSCPPSDQASMESPIHESWQCRLARLTGKDPTVCSQCGQGHLRRVEELAPIPWAGLPKRAPP